MLLLLTLLAVADVHDRFILWESLRADFRRYYVAAGAMTDDEWILKYSYRIEEDVDRLEKRLADTAIDDPLVADRWRLPPAEQCWANVRLADRYLDWLTRLRPFCPDGERRWIDRIAADGRLRRKWWEMAAEVRGGSHYDGPRAGLRHLRSLLTAEDYLDSEWPDALPEAAYSNWWGEPLQLK